MPMKSSLGTGSHVSERIRQVKEQHGVALEALRMTQGRSDRYFFTVSNYLLPALQPY